MHGGSNPGAPHGDGNGIFRHGGDTIEAIALRRDASALLDKLRHAYAWPHDRSSVKSDAIVCLKCGTRLKMFEHHIATTTVFPRRTIRRTRAWRAIIRSSLPTIPTRAAISPGR